MEDLQHPAGWASGQPDPRLVPGPRAGLDARLSHTVAESPGRCSEELTFLLSDFRCVRSLMPGASLFWVNLPCFCLLNALNLEMTEGILGQGSEPED